MSKYVKDLVTRDIKRRLDGVEDAVLVSCVGMDANTTNELRGELAEKNITMFVVKKALARRAAEGTNLAPAFEGANGSIAVCFGGEDFVSLVKEVVRLDKDETKYAKFAAEGGVMDGERLDADGVKAVSKWPSREEQIATLVGQILGPGATLSAAMLGPGKMLNSQLKKISEGEGDE
ncbi:50S ribosomal protein L10 [Rhodopirellula sp. MGV]|uniref:50S ribosomal protein L10 n=1 Tax=Rhodopirellula sp. MGV TaxID=2023130 RepID=UPI000B9635D6|nr:50S ribosomal protein L10 [Rhodopirellula sp. MGV]OYP37039.1 50S ribosomal protein L10 [Rhodopirellula sp. MGV]PNY36199.1 50S ribosomal protein L10 [Rhodopirellula baltica]